MGELGCYRGRDRHSASIAPVCAVGRLALELTGAIDGQDTALTGRTGLARSAHWLASRPPRLAVEQQAALNLAADSLGHDRDAVTRAATSASVATFS